MPQPVTAHGSRTPARLLGPGSLVRTAFLVLLAYAVLGVLAGVVWEWIWTPPGQVVQRHQVFYDSYASLRRVFTGTGLYVLVGAVASALLALGVALLARGRELFTLLLVVVGSAVAAALMWKVGTMLGPGDPATLAAHTVKRTSVPGPLAVEGKSPYLVWPMASLLVLSLVFFARPSSFPAADRTGSRTERREADISGAQHG
jgi:hypothetical protein